MQATAAGRPLFDAAVLRIVAAWIAACVAGALVVSLAWWTVLDSDGAASRDFIIADGTADAIAHGYPVAQPSQISLRRGGSLRIVNNDVVAHTVAWVTVAPGATAVLNVPPGEGNLKVDCTTHPGGSLGFVGASRLPLWQAVAGALVSGTVMGSVIGGVTLITRRLDTD